MTKIPTDLKPGDKLWYSETECATVSHNPIMRGTYWQAHCGTVVQADHPDKQAGGVAYALQSGREIGEDTPPIIRIERIASAPIPAPKPDPLIFGASIPGCEPVPKRDEYVPLTDGEAWMFSIIEGTERSAIRDAHRAGWERRRTP